MRDFASRNEARLSLGIGREAGLAGDLCRPGTGPLRGGLRPSPVQGRNRLLDKDQKDVQVWTGQVTRSGGVPPDIRTSRGLTARPFRTAEKDVIMGYLAFAVIVAAGGALILWLWWRQYRANERLYAGRIGRTANGLPVERIPPLKRTISGPPEEELVRLEFQERIEAWQKHQFQSRRGQNDNKAFVLKGKKYHYVPKAREGNEASTSA